MFVILLDVVVLSGVSHDFYFCSVQMIFACGPFAGWIHLYDTLGSLGTHPSHKKSCDKLCELRDKNVKKRCRSCDMTKKY